MSTPTTHDVRAEVVQDVPLFESIEQAWPTTAGISPDEYEYDRLTSGVADIARPTDPGTSHAAALRTVDSKVVADAIITTYRKHGPLTDEALHILLTTAGYRWRDNRTRTVRAQLVRADQVHDSGLLAKTSSGRNAVEWMVTE